jgi:hypothetical protein
MNPGQTRRPDFRPESANPTSYGGFVKIDGFLDIQIGKVYLYKNLATFRVMTFKHPSGLREGGTILK